MICCAVSNIYDSDARRGRIQQVFVHVLFVFLVLCFEELQLKEHPMLDSSYVNKLKC